MTKIRMTKQRRDVLEKIKTKTLAWGFGDGGGKEYFFIDGTRVSGTVIEGMLRLGLLKTKQTVLGTSQEIEAA